MGLQAFLFFYQVIFGVRFTVFIIFRILIK